MAMRMVEPLKHLKTVLKRQRTMRGLALREVERKVTESR